MINLQCLPQLAVPKIRNKFEYSSLSVMNQLAPGSVPEPIFCDEDKSYCEYWQVFLFVGDGAGVGIS